MEALTAADLERCQDLAERVGWPREPAKWRMLLRLGRGSSPRVAAHVRALGFRDREPAPLMLLGGHLRGERARYHAIVLQAFG